MELSTDQKGALAELSIARDAIALGTGVYAPLGDGERCDLIFDLGERLERIQCKWGPHSTATFSSSGATCAGGRGTGSSDAVTRKTTSMPLPRTAGSWTGASTFRRSGLDAAGTSNFGFAQHGTASESASTGPMTSPSSG
jgi:PD-(D/E)XK endonuclease